MSSQSKQFLAMAPELPEDFPLSTLAEAVATTPSSSDRSTYIADLKRDWCMLIVPHGGYLAALIAHVSKLHFQLRHSGRDQLDLITIHVEYIAKTFIGHAEVRVTELNFGRQYSTVRIQLYQYPKDDRSNTPILCIEALVRQGNLSKEITAGGLTLPTRPIAKLADIPKRESCVERTDPPLLYRRRTAYMKVLFLLPADTDKLGKSAKFGPSVREQWVGWQRDASHDGKGFEITSLCYLADTFFPLPEAYGLKGNWFPTLSCNVEVKKAPPTERGWEWLFMRVEAYQIRNGRCDINVAIFDEEGDLVALSRHAALIVGAGRAMKTSGEKI